MVGAEFDVGGFDGEADGRVAECVELAEALGAVSGIGVVPGCGVTHDLGEAGRQVHDQVEKGIAFDRIAEGRPIGCLAEEVATVDGGAVQAPERNSEDAGDVEEDGAREAAHVHVLM